MSIFSVKGTGWRVLQTLEAMCCAWQWSAAVLHNTMEGGFFSFFFFFKGIISKTFWMQSKSNRWQILGGVHHQDNYIKVDFVQTKTSNFLGNNWEIISLKTIQGLFKKKCWKEAESELKTTATTYLYVRNIVSGNLRTYQVWIDVLIFKNVSFELVYLSAGKKNVTKYIHSWNSFSGSANYCKYRPFSFVALQRLLKMMLLSAFSIILFFQDQ